MTIVSPSLCLRKCPVTISGSLCGEDAIYAVLLDGSGDSSKFGTRLPDELFSLCQSDGGDICATSDAAGAAPLPMELVAINTSAKTAEIWVAVPLTTADTTIYIWYQNSGATLTQPAATSTYGKQAVWNGVNGVGGSGSAVGFVSHDGGFTESTGKITTSPSGGGIDGIIGAAAQFHNGGGAVGMSPSPVDIANPFTVQLWAYYYSQSSERVLQLAGTDGFSIIDYGTALSLAFGGGTSVVCNDSGCYSRTGMWLQHAMIYGGGDKSTPAHFKYKINNTDLTLVAGTAVSGDTVENTNRFAGYYWQAYGGLMDEQRITAGARSDAYLGTDYAIQTSTTGISSGTPAATGTSYVTPANCLRRCALTISGSQVAETGIYAIPFSGSGDSSRLGTRLPSELFTLCQLDGNDICFTSDLEGTNRLPMELVSYDPVALTAEIWVAVPLVASTDKTIYVWYKNNGTLLSQPLATDAAGSLAVWNGATGVGGSGNTLALVSHDGGQTDITGNNTLTTSGITSSTGQIGSAAAFNQPSLVLSNITTPSMPVDTGSAFTLQYWQKYKGLCSQSAYFLPIRMGGSNEFLVAVGDHNGALAGNSLYFGFRNTPALVANPLEASIVDNQNVWRQHAVSYNGGGAGVAANFNYEVDGTLQSPTAIGNIGGSTAPAGIFFGADYSTYWGSYSAYFIGDLDELRMTSVLRSADYLSTDYNLQGSTSLISVGTPASTSTGPSTYEVSVSQTISLSHTAAGSLPAGIKHADATNAITLSQVADCHQVMKHLAAADTITLSQGADCYQAVHHLAVAETLTLSNRGIGSVLRAGATSTLTLSDVATCHNTVHRAGAADTLVVSQHAARGDWGIIHFLHVYDTLSIVDDAERAGSALHEYAGSSRADRLSLGDQATCGVVRAGGKIAGATDTLTLQDAAHRCKTAQASDTLTLSDAAHTTGSKPATDTLALGDMATVNVVRSLQATDALVVEQSFTYILPYKLVQREYHPFVGSGSSVPTPPATTLTGPESLSPGEFQLVYPAAGTPTDILVLRNPELGNKDRLHFNRISRETRGGTLIVYADPMWPKTQTLVLTFSALHRAQGEALLAFMLNHLGLEIGLWDWEGHYWAGVITNPGDPVVQDSRDSFTAGFEFEGQLVNA